MAGAQCRGPVSRPLGRLGARAGTATLGRMRVERVGEFSLGWGESVTWDDRRDRPTSSTVPPVPCTGSTAAPDRCALRSFPVWRPASSWPRTAGWSGPSTTACTSLTSTPGPRTSSPPTRRTRRAGQRRLRRLRRNLVTGTLNLGPAEGSAWWFSTRDGWRPLDDAIANTNGPNAYRQDGADRLIIGDSSGDYYSYPYDGEHGRAGARTVFGDVSGLDGVADGAAFDDEGALWCALIGGGQLARFTVDGLERTMSLRCGTPPTWSSAGRDWTASSWPPSRSGGTGHWTARCSWWTAWACAGAEPRFRLGR